MADSIDSLMKEVSKLRKVLFAQQSGIPERLVVMVTGRTAASPEGVKRAVLDRLAAYGLDNESDAEQAGCTITVICLPWMTDREVGNLKTRLADQSLTSKTAPDSVHISVKPLKAFTGNDSFSLNTEESGKRDDLS